MSAKTVENGQKLSNNSDFYGNFLKLYLMKFLLIFSIFANFQDVFV